MNKLDKTFNSKPLAGKFVTYLAATATVGMLALGANGLLTHAKADARREHWDNKELEEVKELLQKADVAELDQLLADFHGSLSYGGNILAMMSLWADDSSITFNGTPYVGKAAVQSFFAASGYLHNDWVSLAPEFKTRITIHGNRAEATTQCVATDISVVPFVVKGVVQVNAIAEKHNGNWVFISMNNTSPAPL